MAAGPPIGGGEMKIVHLVEYLTGMSRGSKPAVRMSLDLLASQISLACVSGSLHS